MVEIEDFENMWAKYGLRDSPYTTKALSLAGTLDINKLFYGREEELDSIGKRVFSTNNSKTAILGEVGVGKTTFANYLRWLLARKKKIIESKFLTTVEEIKIQENWDMPKFLRETLFSIYNSSKIFKWEEEGIKLNMLRTIGENLGSYYQKIIEFKEDSVKFEKGKNIINSDIPSELLQNWFSELCREIRGYNKKLIFHYNNLENMPEERIGRFLMSIKEIIQIEGTHWLFLGPHNIVSAIENTPQIHSIFNEHILLNPLSEKEVLQILKIRCNFLKIEHGDYFQPYDEKTVLELYRRLNGNIRFIFKLLEDTAYSMPPPCKVTIQEVNYIQEKEKNKIMGSLTSNQQKIISLLIERGEVSMSDLSEGVGILQTNLPKEIKELQKKALINIRKNEEDKRYTMVRLSQRTSISFAFSTINK